MVKKSHDHPSSQRQATYLARLAENGGRAVRIDLTGDDLAKLDALVAKSEAGTRAEMVRVLIRKEWEEKSCMQK